MPMVGGFGAAKPADEEVAAVLSHAAVAEAIKNATGPGEVTPYSYKTQVVRGRGAAAVPATFGPCRSALVHRTVMCRAARIAAEPSGDNGQRFESPAQVST